MFYCRRETGHLTSDHYLTISFLLGTKDETIEVGFGITSSLLIFFFFFAVSFRQRTTDGVGLGINSNYNGFARK